MSESGFAGLKPYWINCLEIIDLVGRNFVGHLLYTNEEAIF